jgi:hypothetical protein
MRLQQCKRWFWPVVSGVLALALAWTLWTNHLLRENTALCNRVVTVQAKWCDGLKQVNALCEQSFTDLASRLGLDTEWMPLVTTALWKRATMGMSIRKARAELGATAWQKDPPLGWPQAGDGIEAGIGGGSDEDDRLPMKRRK